MKEDPPQPAFPATQWTLLERLQAQAQQSSQPGGDPEAMTQLLRAYLPAMQAHLRRRWRLQADRAEDVLQSFVLEKVLTQNLLGKAQQRRGRFRSFLLTALDHFVINALKAERAQCRGGDRVNRPLEEAALSVADEGGAEAFDRAWAQQLIDSALQRMRQTCQDSQRMELFHLFEQRVLLPTLREQPPPSYAQLVQTYGFASPTQASNALVTAKRLFRQVLRSVIAEYEPDERAISEEIRDLIEIFSRPRAGSPPRGCNHV
jgi:RNA polymerase sigma-70 factor (ECF subfamily)